MKVDIEPASIGAREARLETIVSGNHHHDDEASPSRDGDMLQRVAEVLGIPKVAFMQGVAIEAEVDATTEMLRIWHGLEHSTDRRKILSFARALVTARQ